MSEILNDVNVYKKLMLVGNSSFGWQREVGIWDNLTVANNTKTNRLTIGDWEIYQQDDFLRVRNILKFVSYDFS